MHASKNISTHYICDKGNKHVHSITQINQIINLLKDSLMILETDPHDCTNSQHVGVVQNYGTRKLPLRRAFANLSRPVAPPAESGHGIMIGFRVQIRQRFTGGLYLKTLLIGDPFSKLL